jgi:hypothetical protein
MNKQHGQMNPVETHALLLIGGQNFALAITRYIVKLCKLLSGSHAVNYLHSHPSSLPTAKHVR